MAIPPMGGGKPNFDKPGKNLITGESVTFATTVGNWVAFGSNSTVTRETGASAGFPSGSGQNLKIATTQGNGSAGDGSPNNGAQITVTTPGGFKAGRLYVVQFYGAYEVDPFAGSIFSYHKAQIVPSTGALPVAGYIEPYASGTAPYKWILVNHFWRVEADCPSAILKVGRNDSNAGSQSFHIAGHATKGPRFCLADTAPAFDVAATQNELIAGWVTLKNNLYDGTNGAYSPRIDIQSNGVTVSGKSSSNLDAGSITAGGAGYVGIYGPHETIEDLHDSGVNIEVGNDYLGFYISQKDASTVQLYADTTDYMLQLRHRGTGGWSVSSDGTVNARIESYFQWQFTVAGVLTTGTDKAAHFQVPNKAYVDEVRIHVGTAPTGSTLIVDVNDDGTTIFTTQSNRPTIAISSTDDTSGAAACGTAIAKDSVLTIDIDQVGSTIAGSDLTVFVRGRYIW